MQSRPGEAKLKLRVRRPGRATAALPCVPLTRSKLAAVAADLCGHEKYLKTTIFGLTGLQPDYCMVLVGANMVGAAGIARSRWCAPSSA